MLLKLLSKELFVVSQIELYQTSWQYPLINYLGSGRFGFLNWFEFACPLELTTLILCKPFSNLNLFIICFSRILNLRIHEKFSRNFMFRFLEGFKVSFSVMINSYIGIYIVENKTKKIWWKKIVDSEIVKTCDELDLNLFINRLASSLSSQTKDSISRAPMTFSNWARYFLFFGRST